MNDPGDLLYSRIGIGCGAPDAPNGPRLEKLPGGLDQRRQGSVSISRQKLLRRKGRRIPVRLKVLHQGIECIWANDMDAVADSTSPGRSRRNNHGMYGPSITGPVIATQVPGIRGCLIQVGLGWRFLALQLQDDDRTPDEQHDIRTTRLQGQLVFEDRRAIVGGSVGIAELSYLSLQERDGRVPGSHLLFRCVDDESAELRSNSAWKGVAELREQRVPPVARLFSVGGLRLQRISSVSIHAWYSRSVAVSCLAISSQTPKESLTSGCSLGQHSRPTDIPDPRGWTA